MKIENQVLSLELAKRLKELGVKQDGYFCWFKLIESEKDYELSEQWGIDDFDRFEEISAFTVAELGNIIPGGLVKTEIANVKNYPEIKRFIVILSGTSKIIIDNNEANARAKMLIYLLENGFIKNE